MSDQSTDPSRRTVLRGAAVGGAALPLLAACGSGSGSSSASAPSASAAPVTVAAKDVPVGGGKILTDQQVVVTQPEKGTYKAFTAICTHQGCTVNKVLGGKIVCPCHGSTFSITDGSPQGGPAQSALAEKKVSVEGDQISVS
ncbi:Rieske (2Fe-2S) protein [Nocardioides panacis]|uniref:Cytochrome bc1 complex Rieske iron-sulfur subunit n=1 Tax=Nocardioides panacis TaxID=2849501 RepID=A0A975T0X3_9ACTN|nr:Rieske (2Fe-2S) protein [Nocardioides panacis]QWZ09542.1 Rieske (2Fe-2S) protein [Nocardioides panacis]